MLSFFPRGVLDEILNLIESVSEDFPSYSFKVFKIIVSVEIFIKTHHRIKFVTFLAICNCLYLRSYQNVHKFLVKQTIRVVLVYKIAEPYRKTQNFNITNTPRFNVRTE